MRWTQTRRGDPGPGASGSSVFADPSPGSGGGSERTWRDRALARCARLLNRLSWPAFASCTTVVPARRCASTRLSARSVSRGSGGRHQSALGKASLSEVARYTTLINRAQTEQILRDELAQAASAGSPLSLLLIDLDDFKRIND
ncbi:MAG: diguanylate cyclase, partial [Planctomycetes bacterium]|nr:diguanylate cyclase [Planctomycetota bacterium]